MLKGQVWAFLVKVPRRKPALNSFQKIWRMNPETENFLAEQRKLIAEKWKLHGEAGKFRFDRFAIAIAATVSLMTASAAKGGRSGLDGAASAPVRNRSVSAGVAAKL
jgi:hypothetical protein